MNDTEYYRQRRDAERALSLLSERREVREIHEELARLYDALLERDELRSNVVKTRIRQIAN